MKRNLHTQSKGIVHVSLKSANLGLRLFLEVGALAALAYWGFQSGENLKVKLALAFSAPFLAALVWSRFAAPHGPVRVPDSTRFALELAILASAVAGLVVVGRPALAWIFGLAYTVNVLLLSVWGQR
jgi:hypothetical protein